MEKNMNGIKILGTGSYVPSATVTNDDFVKFIDTSDEWIYTRTGIKQRFYSTEKMNFQMAAEAAQNALENSGIKAGEIDLIILSTCSTDFFYPNTACLVQNMIGAVNASCIDVNTACTGFITALDMARRYLCTGDVKKDLVVASEFLTRLLDYTDRTSCFLFGGGAGERARQRSPAHDGDSAGPKRKTAAAQGIPGFTGGHRYGRKQPGPAHFRRNRLI